MTAAELAAVGLLDGEGDGAADPEPRRLVAVAPRPLLVACRGLFAMFADIQLNTQLLNVYKAFLQAVQYETRKRAAKRKTEDPKSVM